MSILKVGDICIGQNLVNRPSYNGVECEIIGGLELRNISYHSEEPNKFKRVGYAVKWQDGSISSQTIHHLRRKSLPGSTADERVYQSLIERLTRRVRA